MLGQIPGNQRFVASGDLGRSGKPKRVFLIATKSIAATASVLSLHNGTSASAEEFIGFEGDMGSRNVYELGRGIRFPNGCYVACGAGSGTTYAVIVYQEEQ